MTLLRTSRPGRWLASVFALVALASTPALAGELYVPNNAPTTPGPGGYSTLMHTQARSY